MVEITFVKKILANGELCQKCNDVANRLEVDGVLPLINHIVVAQENDANSIGMRMAKQYQVERAPFFLVENEAGEITVYDIYFKLKKALIEQGLLKATAPKI